MNAHLFWRCGELDSVADMGSFFGVYAITLGILLKAMQGNAGDA